MRMFSIVARLSTAFVVVAFAATVFAAPHRVVRPLTLPPSPAAQITTVAGTGNQGYLGSGIAATSAYLNNPMGIVVDKTGNLYFADTTNHRVRKVDTNGTITTFAGNGSQAYAGDGGQAAAASLNFPSAVAFDAVGNLYIADSGNSLVRKVTPAGIISTFAGNPAQGQGFSGDKGAATSAQLWNPQGVAVDAKGNVYIADTDNCVIRLVTANGIISTFAGTAPQSDTPLNAFSYPCRYEDSNGNFPNNGGYNGDRAATKAQVNLPQGLAVDTAGNLYIADTGNSLVRMVNVSTGNLTTVAGSFPAGYTGDNGPAIEAALNSPAAVALDSLGNLYIADTQNNAVREVLASTGNIYPVAGNGTYGFSGDTGAATSAQLERPQGVAVDAFGDVYVSDTSNQRIRDVSLKTLTVATPVFSQPGGLYTTTLAIVIQDATPGATIYYTTDGSTPTTSSRTYGGSIPVSAIGTTTIQALAVETGLVNSFVASATYTITTPVLLPVISPATGIYEAAQTVKIADGTAGTTIYYTTDGSIPTTASPKYTAPFIVSANETVQAIAVKAGPVASNVQWANYVFVGTPTVLAYPATAIATPAATLNALVNPAGIAGTYYFQYGTSATALTSATPTKSLSAYTKPVTVSAAVTGLVTKTIYYYQVVVTTKAGTSAGEVLSFTTN